MWALNAETPEPRDDKAGRQEFEHVSRRLTDSFSAHSLDEQDGAPIDFRLAGVGLNEIERVLNEWCWPLVLHLLSSTLFALGILGYGVNGRGAFDALHVADVIFRPGRLFDFSREVRELRGHVAGVIIPVRDECGDLVDLAAWNPDDGALALWRGAASMLGAENILAPRIESEALLAFADVTAWLRAGRVGVVVLDPQRARWRLAGETLVVDDPVFGRRLRDSLALPEPKIFVASNRVRRAA
jgi:hypothetical protein